MNREEALNRIRNLASQLSQVRAQGVDAQAILGFLLGSVYALARAMTLRFEDRTGTALPSSYAVELSGILADIGRGQLPQDGQWLAGFYFNSGLQRLAALYHRALKVLTGKDDDAPRLAQQAVERGLLTQSDIDALATIHKEVNKLKHDTFGVLAGRTVDVPLAVRAAEQASALVKRTAR